MAATTGNEAPNLPKELLDVPSRIQSSEEEISEIQSSEEEISEILSSDEAE